MELSIIIVNYNSKEKLINCLQSLEKVNKVFSYEVIVIDNNSRDNLHDLQFNLNLKIIDSKKNLGMGGGNNLGINKAQGEYILILNPDTVIQDGAVNILLSYLKEHSRVGIVAPQLLNKDLSIQSSCVRFPKVYTPILRRTFLGSVFKNSRDYFMMEDFDHQSIREVDWVMGSCLMFKKNLGLRFDKRYFMYFEDIDICRQSWEKGFSVVYNPEAVIIHDHARQSAKHPWYLAIFMDKLAWCHISSWIKYFIKWGIRNNYK